MTLLEALQETGTSTAVATPCPVGPLNSGHSEADHDAVSPSRRSRITHKERKQTVFFRKFMAT